MSQLKDNLDQILQEKETKIIPENIKSGVQIFNITGALETGIDTSDANATLLDIAENKTAYVNGEKIIGTLTDHRNNGVVGINTISSIDADATSTMMIIYTKQFDDIVADSSTNFNVNMEKSKMAEAIGLTNDKLKLGESILGIEGSVIELKGQEKAITPTTKEQIITPDTNYNGITKLTINPVPSSIDSNIVAENIKNEVTILGVTGTYTGGVKTDNEFNRLFHSSGYLINIADVDGAYSRGIIKQINTVKNSNAYVTLITLPNTEAIPDESQTDDSKIIVSFDIRRMEMNEDNSLNILLNFSTTNPTHSSSAKSGYNNSYYFYINLYDTENNLIYRFNSGINTVYKGINSTAYLCSNLGNCAYQVPYCIYNVENSDPEILDKIFYNCNKATVEAISIE